MKRDVLAATECSQHVVLFLEGHAVKVVREFVDFKRLKSALGVGFGCGWI